MSRKVQGWWTAELGSIWLNILFLIWYCLTIWQVMGWYSSKMGVLFLYLHSFLCSEDYSCVFLWMLSLFLTLGPCHLSSLPVFWEPIKSRQMRGKEEVANNRVSGCGNSGRGPQSYPARSILHILLGLFRHWEGKQLYQHLCCPENCLWRAVPQSAEYLFLSH